MEPLPTEIRDRANALMAERKYGEAIGLYSKALKTELFDRELEVELILSRSCAFVELAEAFRQIPASESERRAHIGLDPTVLAQLGLNDARRAKKASPKSIDVFVQQARAEVLLEQFEEAQKTYLEGLSLDPMHQELQQGINSLQKHLGSPIDADQAGPSPKRRRAGSMDDAECSLCMRLLYEPVTTPCGHSFCRLCFLRAADHNNKCPMCRTILHVGREIPVTLSLRSLIQKSFPDEYDARRIEEEHGGCTDAGSEPPVPLFVMSCLFPGQRMRLNIFEPRYRLMVRRCLEGSKKFGMAMVTGGGSLYPVACEAEIVECQPVPDGRFLLDIVGKRRFRLKSSWEQDGYRVAQPEFFVDEQLEDGSGVLQHLNEVIKQGRGFLENSATDLRIEDLTSIVSEGSPTTERLEKASFCIASFLPLEQLECFQMLSTTSVFERLNLEARVIRRLNRQPCIMS